MDARHQSAIGSRISGQIYARSHKLERSTRHSVLRVDYTTTRLSPTHWPSVKAFYRLFVRTSALLTSENKDAQRLWHTDPERILFSLGHLTSRLGERFHASTY
ncbi:uncharacterized protein PHALS_14317 [Plasmopara halstedii]|uniref:Uncharacterized protein n=1 Tax=Plasmopara halstedii TaxID=4781 RepID=A0A0P1AR53_PLAHL|nr:uncharacterized protein PHALS_14317 [Plasmopara halstedii]CEG44047.1 hypothetical protein PHALS_14317 [Plasmopara halstedii]|eukprot:XP_024580416.1 hypothetical protein PHALS_14317 [Plasmopara halstedii]